MAVNGIDTSAAASFANKSSKANNSSTLDKDAFLQLLVTQMRYQDPLEPTDNTEYMSQLAQFSQLEAMNNLGTEYEKTQAMSLVGEYVLLNVPDASGNIRQVGGLVQYVTISNNKALLFVNNQYYSMDQLDSVVDWEYIEYLNKQMNGEDGTEGADKTEGNDNNNENGDGGDGGDDNTVE